MCSRMLLPLAKSASESATALKLDVASEFPSSEDQRPLHNSHVQLLYGNQRSLDRRFLQPEKKSGVLGRFSILFAEKGCSCISVVVDARSLQHVPEGNSRLPVDGSATFGRHDVMLTCCPDSILEVRGRKAFCQPGQFARASGSIHTSVLWQRHSCQRVLCQ